MGAHAKKSASGAKRWMACPGSIELTDRLPKAFRSKSSAAARLGTAAHGLGEYCLTHGLKSSRSCDGWLSVLDAHEDAFIIPTTAANRKNVYAQAETEYPHVFPIDDDMMSAVDVYLDTVWAILAELSCSELMVEKRFNLEWLRPDMFGTGDASVYQFLGRLVIIDYKHGQGVPVFICEDVDGVLKPNKQLMYYALGLAHEVEWLFEDIELVIVQPRCPEVDDVQRLIVSKAELQEFMRELAAASDMVEEARKDPESHLESGSHCGFCPVGPTCPKQWADTQREAAMDFLDDPFDLDPPELDGTEAALSRLARILLWKPKIDAFLRAADTLGQRLLEQGEEVPEHKLVRKKANRRFSVPFDEVEQAIVDAGLLAEAEARERLYAAPKPKSPAQIEKLGKEFKKLVVGVPNKKHDANDPNSKPWLVPPLAYKPEGGLTMAHVSDHREAVFVTGVAGDFDDDLDEIGEGDE